MNEPLLEASNSAFEDTYESQMMKNGVDQLNNTSGSDDDYGSSHILPVAERQTFEKDDMVIN